MQPNDLVLCADGQTRSIADLAGGKALVLVFTSAQCPYALAYFDKIQRLAEKPHYQSIVFLLVSSNVSTDDEPEGIEAIRSAVPNLSVPVVRDEDALLARKLGATHTPQCFVFAPAGELIYNGPVDNRFAAPDGWEDGQEGHWPWDEPPPPEVEGGGLEDALRRAISGRFADTLVAPNIGCTIKLTQISEPNN